MAEFPVPLDNLISYVKALHPGGGPLENVSDAFAVSTQMDEQADALIGHFVDQARKSGLSWSQIGGAMGVSKQAAQQRFVPTRAADLFPKGAKPFSRFTDRAARVFLAAGTRGAGTGRRRPPRGRPAHRASWPGREGSRRRRRDTRAGLRRRRGRPRPAGGEAGPAELLDLTIDESAKTALKEALKSALRLGHNYIGTEHLLLGVLSRGGPVTDAFTGLGLPAERAEELITAEIAAFQARKEAN